MGASSVDQTFQLFSECWLFRNLERLEKEALFTRVKIRDFAAGKTIFLVGSPGDSGMILLDGTVQISLPGQPQAAFCLLRVIYSEKSPC
jgi:CRP-like cAMP-binding protein